VGFYRRFSPNFGKIAAPLVLTNLTAEGCPQRLEWNDPQKVSFNTLKSYVVSSPVLISTDFDKPFCLQADAS